MTAAGVAPGEGTPVYAPGMSPPQRRQRPGSEDAAHVAALSGGGPSQLGIDGSMRARDVSRPDAEQLIEAEKLVQVSYRPRSKQNGYGAGSGGSSPVSS